MNPPFISWTALSAEQRDEVRRVLGPLYVGKADYSMAFIVRALDCVREKGVLGTLCPASLLSASTAKRWRRHLLDSATPTLVGIIGDHGLFRHALVQVATLVLTKVSSSEPDSSFITLWTSEARGVAGEAMRTLRRITPPGSAAITGEGWRIGRDGTASLVSENDWRPRPKRLETLMNAIQATVPTSVGDLFDVRQGIRTGHREVFLLNRTEFDELPIHEKPFFRPAVENRNIEEGRISACDYLFYPYTFGLPPIPNEQELQRLVSTFYASRLQPNKAALAKRADLVRRTGESAARWWELSQSRPWLANPTQKIITAYFGRAGSFAWDARGDLLVLQGHGWTPRGGLSRAFGAIKEPIREKQSHLFFAAYLALLNSTIFSLLLAENCNHVSGGQFDLSKRFVDNVPLPNLADIAGNSEKGVIVAELDRIGRVIADGQLSEITVRIDQLVAALYGVPIEQWPEA